MNKYTALMHPQNVVVCPQCKSAKIEFLPNLIHCTSCDAKFPQFTNDWINLLPTSFLKNEGTQWEKRLSTMENWYKDLIEVPKSAIDCFISDYTPYASLLSTIRGDVLDIGGGIGITRNYLHPDTKYIVIDPSIEWLTTDWSLILNDFPCLEHKPEFVRGVGEYLPFPSQSFDAILSFWSLNHASNPKMVFDEVARVLRPGGKFLIVLEEMIPNWLDLINPSFPAKTVFKSFFQPNLLQKILPRFYLFNRLIRCKEWPLQNDHIRIKEPEIRNWTARNLEITQRVWIGKYLTFELIKNKGTK